MNHISYILRTISLPSFSKDAVSQTPQLRPSRTEKLVKAKDQREKRERDGSRQEEKRKKRARDKASNVLAGSAELEAVTYVPKTKECRSAYEGVLSAVHGLMGDVPADVLRGAAEEVLYILKDDKLKSADRRVEIEKLVGASLAEKYSSLVSLGVQITDFGVSGAVRADAGDEGDKMDEEMGVAVVFDEDEEASEDDMDEVQSEEEDDDAQRGVEAAHTSAVRTGVEDDEELMAEADEAAEELLHVHAIDAHWLQRGLGGFYDDANMTSKMAGDVLDILGAAGGDERECENKLVMLLDYDKFDFIKRLMRNRWRILYCTRLKQAQSDEARAEVEQSMMLDVAGGGAAILEALRQTGTAETWAQDRAADFASRTRREAIGLGRLAGVQVTEQESRDTLEAQKSTFSGTASSLPKNKGLVLGPAATGGAAAFQDRFADKRGKVAESGASAERLVPGGPVKAGEILDLDALSFAQGGHYMSNKVCELPPKSWRAQKKGYEEVHVPALLKTGGTHSIPLTPISSLPEWVQPAFEGMKTLNTIQSKIRPTALESSENILLCAPTGAGKTNCAVLCMLNTMAAYRDAETGKIDTSAFKIVYVAPMKALVQECVLNFSKRLEKFGMVVRELSGDQSLTYQQITETQVIVTTPEKWDIVTRKGGDRAYTQLVRLIIIDEIHLLHDDRGAVLESIIARTIRQVEQTQDAVRLVGLSATLPNYQDVAALLRVKPETGMFFFDNSFRPVPLQQQYIGVGEKKAIKRFQMMNQICYEKVLHQAGKNQVLIFVHSRAETVKTATAIRDLALHGDTIGQFIREDSATREILAEECETAKSEALKDLLPYGFAIHHAGMARADRNLVEDLFSDKHIQVLVSTATLAWGVNLPAHTVIIKGTQIYSPEKGAWVELSPLDVVQMMGRAGRPQFDSEGEGIIITQHSELQFYLSLMNQQLPVESQMIKHLPDNLNAEIEMGSVTNLKDAADWLAYTYLYTRMLRNPARYGVPAGALNDDASLLQHRIDLAHTAATTLDRHNLIKYDRKTGAFQITALGRVSAHYYVSYASMATYNEHLKPTLSDIELFRLFSFSGEFKHIHVREEEKLELQKLATRVPIPIKESMDEPSAKINALLQAYISNLKLEGFALVADMTFVRQSANRLCRAIFEIALRRKWAAIASKALDLCKMCERRLWLSQSPLRQFKGVPETIVRKLEKKEIAWDRYYDLKPQDLAELVKLPKMGKTLHRLVHQIPRVELSAHVQPVSRALLRVELVITPDFQWDPKVHEHSQTFHIIVEDVDGETILHHEPWQLRAQYAEEEHTVVFAIPISDPLPPQYFLKVVSDRWLHSTATLPISFRHLVLPRKYPPHTELLDLQPLPVSALAHKAFERVYALGSPGASDDHMAAPPLTHFNPIQTQTFASLYEQDDNVLVCAPAGSGRLVCAEFAILRQLKKELVLRAAAGEKKHISGAIVYVAPKQAAVRQRLAEWKEKFGERLGAHVVELCGDVAEDLKALNTAQIAVCTAAKWDVLSRRWKQRKAVQRVSLFIADDLHCVGTAEGAEGPTLEVVVSRMRYMSSQLEAPPRVVGLASSLADAKDVGDWLGCPHASTFSFHSNVRPIPLELFLHSFDTPHFASRLLAMGKVLYGVIARHAPDLPTIAFVPSRKQCQLTAIDIMAHALADVAANKAGGGRDKYVRTAEQVELLELRDVALKQTLAQGVAFYHAGLCASDAKTVRAEYRAGRVWVLVMPAAACWDVALTAHLVVVMGTEAYDGREHRYVDYPVTDLLEMIGKTGRAGVDSDSKCAVFCHTPKKEYLKRLLYEPLPVESRLDHFLHDHMNAEVVTKTIENKQDAVDYLTWTLYYRRLAMNPNFYDLQGSTHRHVSDHLSELVEGVISDLEESRCIAVADEMDIAPLNLGMIGAYYCIAYTTVELFASSVAKKSKVAALLEILANASEYASLPTRQGEEKPLQRLAAHSKHKVPDGAKFTDPHLKAMLLLQSHFSRAPLSTELRSDRDAALRDAVRLLQALVDVISSNGWLVPALAAMELCQMVVQGVWSTDSPLLQVPHVDLDTLDRFKEAGVEVEGVFDILGLDDEIRTKCLALEDPQQMADVAAFCNDYPNIELSFAVSDAEAIRAGDAAAVTVTLEREVDEGAADIGLVKAPRYPLPKKEGWWLCVADVKNNNLLSIKRVAVQARAELQLDFIAPTEPGEHDLMLYFMCDSFLGCDQEYDFKITVLPAQD